MDMYCQVTMVVSVYKWPPIVGPPLIAGPMPCRIVRSESTLPSHIFQFIPELLHGHLLMTMQSCIENMDTEHGRLIESVEFLVVLINMGTLCPLISGFPLFQLLVFVVEPSLNDVAALQ
uniref:Uncharacterized protein n=1 Tax=Spongospora subterranea TaxID=70186 RepID=A0A0H5QQ11_9EUKA|eukprot:CRZ03516.1 hypothetical protein [Spongospora subterranea]